MTAVKPTIAKAQKTTSLPLAKARNILCRQWYTKRLNQCSRIKSWNLSIWQPWFDNYLLQNFNTTLKTFICTPTPPGALTSTCRSMDTHMGLSLHTASGGESGSALARYRLVLLPLNHKQPRKRGPPSSYLVSGFGYNFLSFFKGSAPKRTSSGLLITIPDNPADLSGFAKVLKNIRIPVNVQ